MRRAAASLALPFVGAGLLALAGLAAGAGDAANWPEDAPRTVTDRRGWSVFIRGCAPRA